jgi:gliding motility-associated lipoprotein GldH
MSHALTMCAEKKRKINFHLFGRLSVLFVTGLCIMLCGCDASLIYEKDKTLDNSIWKSNDVVKFNVPITDTNTAYNFYLNIRVNSEYAFANLFLFMQTLYPNGQMSSDTIECFLSGTDGRWLGSRSGRIIDNQILLRKQFKYPLQGTYSFEFEQGMRNTVLENVENFGIRIEKSE